jgi:TonB family protein
VKDPVDDLLVERQSLEGGFGSSLLLAGFGHAFLLAGLFLATLIPPPRPKFEVFGTAVPLPRGGGGTPNPAPSAPAPAKSEPPKAEPKPAEPPRILKPPRDEPKHALPDPNSKKAPKTGPTPAPRWTPDAPDFAPSRPSTGAASTTPGLEFAPPGIGSPTGLATGGDFYLASVQQRIWTIWMQQIRGGDYQQTVSVTFTILADGSVTNVQVTQASGVSLLDLAAQRAVLTAAPFRPLPKTYGTDRLTIQANFKPTT